MFNDAELLGRYARERCESAFSELVARHINLVYAAALREMQGDTALAEDVTQAVFVEAARKAATLSRHPALAGWLYTSVRYTAANVRRSEQRRQQREQEAQAMSEMNSPPSDDASWQQLRPVIDDAMHELNETDRAVVALRFLEGRSFKEVGEALQLKENTARMRAERALEKLRSSLGKRGIASTTAGLAVALSVGAAMSAPSGLAATVAAVAVGSSVGTASLTTLTFVKLMSLTKLQMAAVSAVLIAGISVPIWQQTRLNRLGARNQELQAQAAEVPTLRQEVARLGQLKVDHEELQRLREGQNEVLKLRAKANSGLQAQAEAAQLKSELAREKSKPGTNANAFSGAMSGMMKGYMEQLLVGKMNKMKQKLDLTPDQEQAIRQILIKQADDQAEAAQKIFSGNMSPEEMAHAQKAADADPEKQIQALLTPAQQAAYKEYKQEDALSNARLAANAEMLQMQDNLGLSQEQQDKVYGILYEQYARTLSGKANDTAPKSADPTVAAQNQLDQKLKALEEVLTPAQLDSYRQMQQAQLKMMEGFLGNTKKGSGAAPLAGESGAP